ncbi:hypothetical protein CsSME_00034057 [Camellia sinensis var. sinensis]
MLANFFLTCTRAQNAPETEAKIGCTARFLSNTLRLYLTCIRNTLEAAMCYRYNFPCQEVERHNKPELL